MQCVSKGWFADIREETVLSLFCKKLQNRGFILYVCKIKENRFSGKIRSYFIDQRETLVSSLFDEMEKLVREAGVARINFENQFVLSEMYSGVRFSD